MKKSQVTVKKSEIDITLDGCDPGSVYDNDIDSKKYSFPDPQSLALKYGLVKEDEPMQSPGKRLTEQIIDSDQLRTQEHALQMQSLVRKLDEKNKKIESLCVLLEVTGV